jgi:general secretion pathway protein A
MYEVFFGLRERPFELGSNRRFLFLPDVHKEALSNLHYGIASRKGVTVLTGEVGTGKTTLIRAAIERMDRTTLCLHMSNPRLTRDEFFEFLAQGFELGPGAGESKVSCLLALEDRLVSRMNRGEHSALIVDEAQSLSDELVEEIRLLTNIEVAGARPLSIVLVGQPEFAERLNEAAFRHLKQRIALRCSLRALTLQETAGYIATRIRVAGGDAAATFTREAVQFIHEVSGGIPRVISVLCDNALVNGFAAGQRPVGSKLVREVCADFDIACRAASAAEEQAETVTVATVADVKPAVVAPVTATAKVDQPPIDGAGSPAAAPAEAPEDAAPLFGSFGGRRRRFGIF